MCKKNNGMGFDPLFFRDKEEDVTDTEKRQEDTIQIKL
jgi:hypothetical protein